MKLVTTEATLRVATEGEVSGVVDTATATPEDRRAWMARATDEGNGELVGALFAEHEDIYGDADDGPTPAAANPGAGVEVGRDASSWEQAGLVNVKTVYPDDSPYHGMPGLEGPPSSWLATMSEDLAAMGINPVAAVSHVRLWRPQAPATHYEVGAVIDGVYAKFHLTGSGYAMIYNARPPSSDDPYYGAPTDYVTSSVTASDLYGTFLQMASEKIYDIESNDCEDFAGDLCSRLSGQWVET
jgi:hypothetical protein